MEPYKHINPDSFAWCNPPCRANQLDPAFLRRLDEAFSIAQVPFSPYSAFRSIEYESSHGRSARSPHTKGIAVDIACLTPIYRYRILNALLASGFKRIGLFPNYIHVEEDASKPPAIWSK